MITYQLSQRMRLWQLFFHFTFFFLFLLSFFFIESELKFYLFALWASFLLLFSLVFKLNNYFAVSNPMNKQNRVVFFLLWLWSILLVLNVFFSSHLSLSLEKMLFYLLAFALFVFFSLIPNHFLQKRYFFYQLSILTLVLNLIVLGFTFYPPPADLFPKMNLFLRTYGHNHYAAYLLLVLPIFWWQLFLPQLEKRISTDQQIKFLTIILLFSSYLLIMLSLARLVLFLAFLQFLIIFFKQRHCFYHFTEHAFLKQIFKGLLFLVLASMIVFSVLSIPLANQSSNFCPLVIAKKEVCQPLRDNDRLAYWRKAWLIFRQHPLFGVGLQGFQSAGRPIIIDQRQALTSYAHNIFLHNLAETGILVGALFIILIFMIFYRTFQLAKQNQRPLYKFLWLGAFFSLLNALFDFDWHFFTIFSLSLIFLAIIMGANQVTNKEIKSSTWPIIKIYYFLIFVLSIGLLLYNLAAVVLIRQNQQAVVIRHLPYADQSIRTLLRERRLLLEDFKTLYPYYSSDAEFIYKFLFVENLDLNHQKMITLQYANLDPVGFLSYLNLEKYQASEALPLVEKLVALVKENNFLNQTRFFDYWQQKKLAEQIFNLANQAYVSNELHLAVNYYQVALWLNPYIMSDLQASFLLEPDLAKSTQFLKTWPDLVPAEMGIYFYDYMALYQRVLLKLFEQNRLDEFIDLAEAIFVHEKNFSWFLWQDLFDLSNSKLQKAKLLVIYEHFQHLSTWYDFLPKIEKMQAEN